MYELLIGTFVTFFVVIDPVGIAPVFAVLTNGASQSFKHRMVFKATLTGGIILLFFAFLGTYMLAALGISLPAFKAAGGALLFMIALEMIFEKRTERREKTTEGKTHDAEVHEPDESYEDISVFPIAIPFMAGPGSIATILLLMSQHSGSITEQGLVIAALFAALLATLIILIAATRIIDFLGETVANAITRILGVILAAMATQYIFDGIKAAFLV